MARTAADEFPADDLAFEDTTLVKVEGNRDEGWSVERDDGWHFFVPAGSPVKPRVGMSARFYGKGIGYTVRGLFLDGRKVFYRTEAEDAEHHEIQTYGADAADWLARWDRGDGVWSIEMGGLGPGYEQCIQITAAELLRHLLSAGYDSEAWADDEARERDQEAIRSAALANERIDRLGLSGAQFGAAMNLATNLYRRGPRACFTDPRVADRKIQVSREFPTA